MSVADDHGRFHALPKLLRAACYPLQIDKVSDADIGKWLSECETAALVSVYPASDGKRYIQIVKFGQQVRSKSKFPDPIAGRSLAIASNCEQPQANEHLGVFVSEVEVECVEDGGIAPAVPLPPAFIGDANAGEIDAKARVVLSSAWELPTQWGLDAEELGWKPAEILKESSKFRQFWTVGRGSGRRKTVRGWRQAWSNWLGQAERYAA